MRFKLIEGENKRSEDKRRIERREEKNRRKKRIERREEKLG